MHNKSENLNPYAISYARRGTRSISHLHLTFEKQSTVLQATPNFVYGFWAESQKPNSLHYLKLHCLFRYPPEDTHTHNIILTSNIWKTFR